MGLHYAGGVWACNMLPTVPEARLLPWRLPGYGFRSSVSRQQNKTKRMLLHLRSLTLSGHAADLSDLGTSMPHPSV